MVGVNYRKLIFLAATPSKPSANSFDAKETNQAQELRIADEIANAEFCYAPAADG